MNARLSISVLALVLVALGVFLHLAQEPAQQVELTRSAELGADGDRATSALVGADEPRANATGPEREAAPDSAELRAPAPTSEPGLTGRVVTRAGAPVEGAEVSVFFGASETSRHERLRTVTSDATGRYHVAVEGAGSYRLDFFHGDHGVARHGPEQVTGNARRDLGDAVLLERGVLHGFVEFPSGATVRDLGIYAQRVRDDAPDEDPEAFPFSSRFRGPQPVPEELGAARSYGLCTSDADGAFRIVGLWPGEYTLSWFNPSDPQRSKKPLPGEHATGTVVLRVRVDMRRVGVELGADYYDADGLPLPTRAWCAAPDGTATPEVFLLQGPRAWFAIGANAAPEARIVGVKQHSGGPCEREVHLAAEEYERWVPLAPSRVRGVGSVLVQVQTPAGGGSVEEAGPFELELLSPAGRLSMYRRRFSDPPARVDDLGVGEYDLRLSSRSADGAWLPVEGTVAVAAGRTSVVDLRPERGGLLELHLHGPQAGRLGRQTPKLTVRAVGGGAELDLEFRRDEFEDERVSYRLLKAVPAGQYEVRVDLRGATAAGSVHLVAGETRGLDLALEGGPAPQPPPPGAPRLLPGRGVLR